jgi:hypothetical protein
MVQVSAGSCNLLAFVVLEKHNHLTLHMDSKPAQNIYDSVQIACRNSLFLLINIWEIGIFAPSLKANRDFNFVFLTL